MKNKLFISSEVHGNAAKIADILKDICLKIDEKNFDVSKYSDDITYIGIIVNCFPDDWLLKGWGKPRKYICYKKGSADIRLPIPYIEFMNANYNLKYLIAVKNIIDSINVIGERCRKSKRASFDSEGMINDILFRLHIEKENINEVTGIIQNMPK
jgi:hypothetical protein